MERSSILDIIDIGIFEVDNNLNCLCVNKYIINYFNIKLLETDELFSRDDQASPSKLFSYMINSLHNDDSIIENKKSEDFIKNNIESESICRLLNKKTDTYHWIKLKRRINKKSPNDITFLFIFEDIDDFKKLEIDLHKSETMIENSYSNKAIFLTNMNHEIRTPLNGIIGMLTLLENTSLNNDQKDYIEMLRECSINLMTIINDILDYSKLEAGKINLDVKCIDLRNCIETTNDILLSKIYEKNIDYNYSININIPRLIKGDSNRIKQILLNLLSNSIKFINKDTINSPTIFLDVTVEKSSEDQNNFKIKFTINDSGCGIEYNDRDKLFKSFTLTTTTHNQGTGLGLAISKELVELMGGDIWIDWSEIGKGTRFCFTILTQICCGCETEQSDDCKTETDNSILRDSTV
jgi:signal transduction histidine kinase